MNKKILAIIGTYRRNGIIEETVDCILEAAKEKGAQVKKINLLDKHIEFCMNCRSCVQESPDISRGVCVTEDDMQEIFSDIDECDGIILASPVNFSNVTALFRKFSERLLVYAYWPWGAGIPKDRIKKLDRKAIVVTSSACPAFIGQIIMPQPKKVLKTCAKLMGFKVIKSLYFGGVSMKENQKLNPNDIEKAKQTGMLIAA